LLMCMNTLFSLLRATVVRLIIPQPLLKKWFGRFSHTHRVHSQYDEWLKNNQPAAAPPGA
jgi:hypothetical protein